MVKRLPLVVIVTAVLFVGLIVAGYWLHWSWTGLTNDDGSIKTLWDWLQLLGIFALPVVLGVGAFLLMRRQDRVHQTENARSQQENSLRFYIDSMSELLLVNDLQNASGNDIVRKIARARTLTVLRRLDPARKADVLQFLREVNVIAKDNPIVELEGADFSEIKLSGARLNEVDLSGANLGQARLSGANLQQARLRGIRLNGANLNDSDLSEADLSEADLSGADLGWVILSGPSQSLIFLSPSNLSEANLSKANLQDANLRGANLPRADLRKARLHGASLSGANLSGANLTSTDLSDLDLDGVNLSEANLTNAILSEANLHGVNLHQTDLSGVDLSHVKGLTNEQIGKAGSLQDVTLPEGLQAPQ